MHFNSFLFELGMLVSGIFIVAVIVYIFKKIQYLYFTPNEEAAKKFEVNYSILLWGLLILILVIIKLLK